MYPYCIPVLIMIIVAGYQLLTGSFLFVVLVCRQKKFTKYIQFLFLKITQYYGNEAKKPLLSVC